jgi:valyl-tRNA synthetase
MRVLQVSLVSSAEEAAAAAPPGGSVSVVVSEGLQLLLPLAGLFDVDKELKRLEKQKAKVRGRDLSCGAGSVSTLLGS